MLKESRTYVQATGAQSHYLIADERYPTFRLSSLSKSDAEEPEECFVDATGSRCLNLEVSRTELE